MTDDALIDFISAAKSSPLPPGVAEIMRQQLLDFVAVTLAGRFEAESSYSIIEAVERLAGANGECSVAGKSRGFPSHYAALLNGTFAHSLDFDDTHIPSTVHPGACIFPAVLALGEHFDSNAADALAATAIGYEICCRMGMAFGQSLYDRGFHPTAIAGIFGSVAAAASLADLSREATRSAIGLAGSMAAGSMQYMSSGAWNKRIHPGWAAHNAIICVTLAASGVIGARDALSGRLGALRAYSDAPLPIEEWASDLGSRWELLGTGVKPYPGCRAAHGAIDAAIAAHQQGFAPAPGDRIQLALSRLGFELVGRPDEAKLSPSNTVDCQFSAYFLAAVALLDGRVGWDSYQRRRDPDVLELMGAIGIEIDDTLPTAGAELEVKIRGAKTLIRVESPLGEPGPDLSWTMFKEKFEATAGPLLSERDRRWLVGQVQSLRGQAPLRPLARLLRRATRD